MAYRPKVSYVVVEKSVVFVIDLHILARRFG